MSGRHFSQPNPGPRGTRAASAGANACARATGRPNSGSRPASSTTEHTLEVRASRKKTTRREFLAASGAFVALAALAGLGATRLLSNPGDPRFATFAQVQEPQPAPELREEQYRRVTLSAVGDHLMNMPVVEAADYNAGETGDGWFDFTPMYQGVADIVASHDLNFIDIETIRTANTSLIETLSEVQRIQLEGAQKRQEASDELNRLEKELKDKLLEIRK